MSKTIEGKPSQVSFHILFALSARPRHGYEIMQQIAQDTKGGITIGAGTLYGSLKQLREDNQIEEIPFGNNARRREYRLTRKGWNTLTTELEYYETIVKTAKARRII